MSWTLAQPLGLLALGSLPLVWWLHRYVARTRPRSVSYIDLWLDADQVSAEGATRKLPPPSWVLACELAAAALASLLLAGLDVRFLTEAPRLAAVIDGSLSMGGGPEGNTGVDEARKRLAAVARRLPDVEWTLIVSGPSPVIAAEHVDAKAMDAALRALQPTAPSHDVSGAADLAAFLGFEPANVLLLSDDATVQHERLTRVGAKAPNIGIVAANWPLGGQPFVALRSFGASGSSSVDLEIRGDEQPLDTQRVSLEDGSEVSLAIPVAAGVERVDIRLPPDALLADNAVTLLRPSAPMLGVKNMHPNEELAHAVERAVQAIAALVLTDGDDAAIVVTHDGKGASTQGWTVLFMPEEEGVRSRAQTDLAAHPFAPVVHGIDLHGLLWYGWNRDAPADSTPVVESTRGATMWQRERLVALDVDVARSNLLHHPAFPLLFDNLARALLASEGGLVRRNLKAGERLRIGRPRHWQGPVEITAPSGRVQRFEKDERALDLGALVETGVYRVRTEDVSESFAVNLLDPRESDLSARAPSNDVPALTPRQQQAMKASLLPQLLVLLCGAFVFLAWTLLRRRLPRS
jgi:hypothetical protein